MMIYAGFWRRFAAQAIDWTLISVMMWIVLFPLMLLAGGALMGQDLIKAAEKRKAEQSQPHSQMQLIEKIVPVSNSMVLSQAAQTVPTEQPLTYSTPTPEADTAPAMPSTPQYAPAQPPVTVTQDYPAHYKNPQDLEKESADIMGPIIGLLINGVASILIWGVGIAYHTYFIGSKWQATPGKRVMNCCVVSRDGKRIDYGHAFGRHIACVLSWLPFPPICIGFFLAGWNGEKKALHDMIAGTRVVRTVASPPVIATR